MSSTPPKSLVDHALSQWQTSGARQQLPVEGWSMWPLLRPGDSILVDFGRKPTTSRQLLVFKQDNTIIVHRIHKQLPHGRYQTQGDNAKQLDPVVEADQILGIAVVRLRQQRTRSLTSKVGQLNSLGCYAVARMRLNTAKIARKFDLRRPSFL